MRVGLRAVQVNGLQAIPARERCESGGDICEIRVTIPENPFWGALRRSRSTTRCAKTSGKKSLEESIVSRNKSPAASPSRKNNLVIEYTEQGEFWSDAKGDQDNNAKTKLVARPAFPQKSPREKDGARRGETNQVAACVTMVRLPAESSGLGDQ